MAGGVAIFVAGGLGVNGDCISTIPIAISCSSPLVSCVTLLNASAITAGSGAVSNTSTVTPSPFACWSSAGSWETVIGQRPGEAVQTLFASTATGGVSGQPCDTSPVQAPSQFGIEETCTPSALNSPLLMWLTTSG